MHPENLPAVPIEFRRSIFNANARNRITEHRKDAAEMAADSIKPFADFAAALIEEPKIDTRHSPLFRIGKNRSGETIYMGAQTKFTTKNPQHYFFVAFTAVEMTPEDYDQLSEEDQGNLPQVGKTTDGNVCYGVVRAIEKLSDVIEGYDGLTTAEAIEYRKAESINQVQNVAETTEFIKNAILDTELNPGATTLYPALTQTILMERLESQPATG